MKNNEIQENLQNWDDRADVHANGGYGDLTSFIKDKNKITSTVQRDLKVLYPHLLNQTMKGKRLLHLQCHIGIDTISWERLGAVNVHGIDFSPNSLKYAREINEKAGSKVIFVESDARFASKTLFNQLGKFDIIVTSAGTITWLPDLQDWANSISELLAPGGIFMIRDNHPLLFALDNDGLEITQNYFSVTKVSYETDASYTPGSAGQIKHIKNHNWAHDFAEMTRVLINAGLTIEAIGEEKSTDWKSLPILEYSEADDSWLMPNNYPQIPLTFSIVARKKVFREN